MQEQPDEEAAADSAAANDSSRQLRSQVLKQLDTQTVLRVLSIVCDESVCKAQLATLLILTFSKILASAWPDARVGLPRGEQALDASAAAPEDWPEPHEARQRVSRKLSTFHFLSSQRQLRSRAITYKYICSPLHLQALGIETEADIKRLVEYFMVVKEEPQPPPAPAALEGPADGAATSEMSRASSGTRRMGSRVEAEGGAGEGAAAGGPPSRAPSGTAGDAHSTRSAASATGGGQAQDVPEVVVVAPSNGERTTDKLAVREARTSVEFVHPNDALSVLLQFVDDNRHLMHRFAYSSLLYYYCTNIYK